MSAFVVSDAHLDVVVTAIVDLARRRRSDYPFDVEHDGVTHAPWTHTPPGADNHETCDLLAFGRRIRAIPPQALGELLLAANVASVNHRYEEADDVRPYQFRKRHVGVVQAIKAIHCLCYQSCEHPGWEASLAKAILDRALDCLARYIPGYDEAEWEIRAA